MIKCIELVGTQNLSYNSDMVYPEGVSHHNMDTVQ